MIGKIRWVIGVALVTIAALSFALWPVNCEGKSSAPESVHLLVPEEMTKVCETPLGSHIRWSYNPETSVNPMGGEVLSVSTGPVPPNWGQFVFIVSIAGLVTGLLMFLILFVNSARNSASGA